MNSWSGSNVFQVRTAPYISIKCSTRIFVHRISRSNCRRLFNEWGPDKGRLLYDRDCSSKVLEKTCQCLDLSKENTYYFGLFLIKKENDGGVTLVRKLMDFEAPYISQRFLHYCRIRSKIALNLLYIETSSDVDRGWILTTNEIKDQLNHLQSNGNKKKVRCIFSSNKKKI